MSNTEINKWISVKDGLPKLRKDYWDEQDKCYKSDIIIPVIVYDGEFVFEANATDGGFMNKHITHWQYYPKPPNQLIS